MPNFDKTGPQGQGSMTGRGQGKCVEDKNNQIENKWCGRGMGRGKGCGRRGMGVQFRVEDKNNSK